jgi:starvation-inducible outer membrane lipoprotein
LIDYNNEIYLSAGQMGMQPYQLIKHDSNGQYQWSINRDLPMTPPFGDFSYGLMDTGQNEYILYVWSC